MVHAKDDIVSTHLLNQGRHQQNPTQKPELTMGGKAFGRETISVPLRPSTSTPTKEAPQLHAATLILARIWVTSR